MKKILLAATFYFVSTYSIFGQTMQASIGAGSTTKRVRIYIRPTALTNGTLSTLQFDIAIPASVTPVPTLSIIGVPTIGSGWQIDPSYVEDGFRHYQIVTGVSPSVNIAANTETEVMQLEFNGGPSGANNVSLYTLPAGGASGNALFLCTGAATSVEGQLYYVRSGTTVLNNNSYTGALPSNATVGGIILPVNWLGFNASKNGRDGVLDWQVANDDFSKHYELQRSTNGVDFIAIATIDKATNSGSMGRYNYKDLNIDNLGAEVVYYRLKQVDNDSKFSYSEVRSLKININGRGIQMYPNPVKSGFYVNIPFTNSDQSKVGLTILNNNGQVVQSKEINSQQATNYYYNINGSNFPAGDYYLKIVRNGQVLDIKKFLISKE
jgi:Secretion system C-terminal sorting domain